jgi:hypothetical protein
MEDQKKDLMLESEFDNLTAALSQAVYTWRIDNPQQRSIKLESSDFNTTIRSAARKIVFGMPKAGTK